MLPDLPLTPSEKRIASHALPSVGSDSAAPSLPDLDTLISLRAVSPTPTLAEEVILETVLSQSDASRSISEIDTTLNVPASNARSLAAQTSASFESVSNSKRPQRGGKGKGKAVSDENAKEAGSSGTPILRSSDRDVMIRVGFQTPTPSENTAAFRTRINDGIPKLAESIVHVEKDLGLKLDAVRDRIAFLEKVSGETTSRVESSAARSTEALALHDRLRVSLKEHSDSVTATHDMLRTRIDSVATHSATGNDLVSNSLFVQLYNTVKSHEKLIGDLSKSITKLTHVTSAIPSHSLSPATASSGLGALSSAASNSHLASGAAIPPPTVPAKRRWSDDEDFETTDVMLMNCDTIKYNAIQIMNFVCEKMGWRNGKVWRAWKTKDRENSIYVRFSSSLLATDFFQTFRKSNLPWSVRVTKVMSPSMNQSSSIVDISVPGGGPGGGIPVGSGVPMEDISVAVPASTYPFTFAAGSNGINNMSW